MRKCRFVIQTFLGGKKFENQCNTVKISFKYIKNLVFFPKIIGTKKITFFPRYFYFKALRKTFSFY